MSKNCLNVFVKIFFYLNHYYMSLIRTYIFCRIIGIEILIGYSLSYLLLCEDILSLLQHNCQVVLLLILDLSNGHQNLLVFWIQENLIHLLRLLINHDILILHDHKLLLLLIRVYEFLIIYDPLVARSLMRLLDNRISLLLVYWIDFYGHVFAIADFHIWSKLNLILLLLQIWCLLVNHILLIIQLLFLLILFNQILLKL